MPGDTTRRRRTLPFLRLRALLSGGLVLGLGAVATLASWNDSEYTRVSLTSSVFNTESSVNGLPYADNATSPGPIVTFAGAGFSPGTSVYLPVLIRSKATSVPGTVVLEAPVVGGADAATLGAAFVYRVVRPTVSGTGTITCDVSAFAAGSTYVVGTSATSRAFTAGQEVGLVNTLAAGAPAAAGAVTGFCFQITLPAGADNSLQGKAATATWRFVATSS